jgi:hypothetical protein
MKGSLSWVPAVLRTSGGPFHNESRCRLPSFTAEGIVDFPWEIESMKLLLGSLALTVVLSGPAFAASDDAKWVAKCVSDNAGAKVSVEIIAKYCTCMNNEMDDNETLSITAWEKTAKGKVAMASCDKKSGWDKK